VSNGTNEEDVHEHPLALSFVVIVEPKVRKNSTIDERVEDATEYLNRIKSEVAAFVEHFEGVSIWK